MGVKASVKYFSRKFHQNFQGCFKNLSMKLCFAILCMNLIAATRAEGGLVFSCLKLTPATPERNFFIWLDSELYIRSNMKIVSSIMFVHATIPTYF